MKKLLTIALTLALLLSLTACAGETKTAGTPPEPKTEQTAPKTDNPAPEPEPNWRYEVEMRTVEDSFAGEGGMTLATVSCEYPELVAVSDGATGKTCPDEMQKVLDAFNQGIRDYVRELGTADDLGQAALEQYNETAPEYREHFAAYFDSTETAEPYRRGDLLELSVFRGSYWGGAHGAESVKNFHFDLGTGEFVELSDLTDAPEKLRGAVADEIVGGIYDRGEEDWYFDGFYDVIREHGEFNVSFGEDGMSVIFDEYEIAPYAAGLPEFFIPYGSVCRFLNERGERLLDPSLEARVLGDYYDALDMWYWFEGAAPVDYNDTRMEAVDALGTEMMYYSRFTEPGIGTMAELKARLATRFSDELIESRLSGDLFREFDGVLYAAAAGRGTDMTVRTVDYTVELNADKSGGRILADIQRQDFDESSQEWTATGVTDQVEFPFTLGDGGAVFGAFPTIW